MNSFVTASFTILLIVGCITYFTRNADHLLTTIHKALDANNQEIAARNCAEIKALALNIADAEKMLLVNHPDKFIEITEGALKKTMALREKLRELNYPDVLDESDCRWLDLSGATFVAVPSLENQSQNKPNWTVEIRRIQTQEPNP